MPRAFEPNKAFPFVWHYWQDRVPVGNHKDIKNVQKAITDGNLCSAEHPDKKKRVKH
ncbi:MAG: hypothetical protein AB8U25_02980 [Rickettsiales endosymbiont of Dermacentor nuttalli]